MAQLAALGRLGGGWPRSLEANSARQVPQSRLRTAWAFSLRFGHFSAYPAFGLDLARDLEDDMRRLAPAWALPILYEIPFAFRPKACRRHYGLQDISKRAAPRI